MATTASKLLKEAGDLEPHEAVRLLLAATGNNRNWMLGDPLVAEPDVNRFRLLVTRRRSGEPLQYIEESVQFGPIELYVDDRVLIPRPETERLLELALGELEGRPDPMVLDLCTGSGNLALALKHAIAAASVVAVDLSPNALAVAIDNGVRLGLDVTFHRGDLFSPLPVDLAGSFDLIVSNPPYVSTGEYADLPAEVAAFEPATALVAGRDGLDVLRRIAAEAIGWMRPGAAIICEIGETQGDACRELFADYRAGIVQDLTGRDRFVRGYAPMPGDVH